MKVYVLTCDSYNYEDYTQNSMLLGIYASIDKAVAARGAFIKDEYGDYTPHIDDNNNVVIEEYFGGDKIAYSETYRIQEWAVQ